MKKRKYNTGSILQQDQQAAARFTEMLTDMLGAERHQLLLLRLAKKSCTSLNLQNMLARHLDDTREHCEKLEEALVLLEQEPVVRQPEAILSIARAAEEQIAATEKGSIARDAGLVAIVRKMENYEIDRYTDLTQLAGELEYDAILDMLETILNEEREADDLLAVLCPQQEDV